VIRSDHTTKLILKESGSKILHSCQPSVSCPNHLLSIPLQHC